MSAYAKKMHASDVAPSGLLRPGVVMAMNIALVTLTASFFVAYLAMNSKAATNGFVIRSMEHQVAELRDEQEKLNIEAASSRSMEELERRVGELGLVPVGSIEYINGGQGIVAVK